MVVGEDDAHHLEDELPDVEIAPKVALGDGEIDRAMQLPVESREMLDSMWKGLDRKLRGAE